jgi:hypothetical protein
MFHCVWPERALPTILQSDHRRWVVKNPASYFGNPEFKSHRSIITTQISPGFS